MADTHRTIRLNWLANTQAICDTATISQELIRYAANGGALEMISGVTSASWGVLGLPDGRVVIPALGPRRHRLVAYAAGKMPATLIATREETSSPMAAVGSDRIAITLNWTGQLTY